MEKSSNMPNFPTTIKYLEDNINLATSEKMSQMLLKHHSEMEDNFRVYQSEICTLRDEVRMAVKEIDVDRVLSEKVKEFSEITKNSSESVLNSYLLH